MLLQTTAFGRICRKSKTKKRMVMVLIREKKPAKGGREDSFDRAPSKLRRVSKGKRA